MTQHTDAHALANAANQRFENTMHRFLKRWAKTNGQATLLRFDQPLGDYLQGDALRDFFLSTSHPMHELLKHTVIAKHLGRSVRRVYFDPVTGDPLFAVTEQRIYNLARRLDSEKMQVPFRSVQPNKQTPEGDTADIASYPEQSDTLRYNSGNHFSSRPANGNVFDENSHRCLAESGGRLQVLFSRGYLEDRLQEVKVLTAAAQAAGQTGPLFFVICSRHSAKEGHYGVNLLVMDPATPLYPKRVLICDTLLKELPQHPRWWYFFMEEYASVFGAAVKDLIEDISHPLQKVNVSGDDPYRHDWDCPYYAAAMTLALIRIVRARPELPLSGNTEAIHRAMKKELGEYYLPDGTIKDRAGIRLANRLKRWNSGRLLIRIIVAEAKTQILESLSA